MQRLFLSLLVASLTGLSAIAATDSGEKSDTSARYVPRHEAGRAGFVNRGLQKYWWYDAHCQGRGEKLMNSGYTVEWLISPQYDNVSKGFNEGLAAVELNGMVGYVDKANRFIIEPQFESDRFPETFTNGLSKLYQGGKYGYIDKVGEVLIEPRFDGVRPFRDNNIAFVKMGNKFGAIDLKGEILIPCVHTTPESMTIARNQKEWKRVDSLVQARVAEGYYDSELSQIRSAEKWANTLIYDPDFRNTVPEDVQVRDTLKRKGLKCGGKWLTGPDYTSITPLEGGYFAVVSSHRKGVCDSYGREIISCMYDDVEYCAEDEIFIVKTDGKSGLYSCTGAMILPPCLDEIGAFSAGFASCTLAGVEGTVDTNGQAVSEDFLEDVISLALDQDTPTRIATLKQLITFKPSYAQAHNNLAICYIATEQYNVGIPMLKLASKLDPDDSVIAENLANAKAAKKEKNMEKFRNIFPDKKNRR